MRRALAQVIATFGGVGLLPLAPGTWGSAAALPLGWLAHGLGGFALVALVTVVAFAAGWWATAEVTRGRAEQDPGEIVIDEVAGQLVALWPLSLGLTVMGAPAWLFPWPGWVGGFVMFRLFDILKPGPVRRADRMHTPLGVMLDDLVAGALAAVVVTAAAAVAHGWLR
ncbi:MAG: phosphatidylglycerophosphatase A [Alphaproteobacteria bacterium]|nr:MAG: phosphatidylglycerophosphatase A [Alphaproteobacteria bacterium]